MGLQLLLLLLVDLALLPTVIALGVDCAQAQSGCGLPLSKDLIFGFEHGRSLNLLFSCGFLLGQLLDLVGVFDSFLDGVVRVVAGFRDTEELRVGDSLTIASQLCELFPRVARGVVQDHCGISGGPSDVKLDDG